MLLPTATYQDVPLPDFTFLQRFQPHRLGLPLAQDSTFGAHYFIQNIELAKLEGHVLDFLSSSSPLFGRSALIAKVEDWGAETDQVGSQPLGFKSAFLTNKWRRF